MKCNFDCFNCKFSDCKCKSNAPPTPWEKAALRYALTGDAVSKIITQPKQRKAKKCEKTQKAERSRYIRVHSA